MSNPVRVLSVLPDTPDGYRMQRRALSRGISRTTADAFNNAPGRPFFLPNGEAKAARPHVHAARLSVTDLLSRSALAARPALDFLIPGKAVG